MEENRNRIFQTATDLEKKPYEEAVRAFEAGIRKSRVNLHGYLLARGNKIVAERYYEPFHAKFQHRMYSVAKSFTSLAIGLLEEEGKLSLSDFICDYFPDKLPKEGTHPYIQAMTIRDMLCMATAHKNTTYKDYPDKDWVASFFKVKPDHMPGTLFSYDTSSSLVLAALAERLSGMELLAYLRKKGLDEIGFSKEAKMLKAPMGESQGGSGLLCTLRDMASVAWLCANGGSFHGKQLLPRQYIKEATAKQISTSLQPVVDEQQGYGYMFWRTRYGGFCMYGMGGQLALAFPEHDLLFATIADTQGSPAGLQALYEVFYRTLFSYAAGTHMEEGGSKTGFATEPLVTGENTEGTDQFCGVTYLLSENQAGIERIRLLTESDGGSLWYEREGKEHVLFFKTGDYQRQQFPGTKEPCMVTGAFEDAKTFALRAYLIGEEFGHVFFNLGFAGSAVTVAMKRAGETIVKEYDGFAAGRRE